MAAPRPKKPIVPRPAKDLSNNPKDLRNKALRDANRAANQNKPRYQQKIGPTQPQGPEAPRYRQKIGPVRPSASSSLAKGLLKKVPVVGTAIGFIADAAPVGEGSTKDKYSTLKKKYSSPIGPKQPEVSKKSVVSPTTGSGRPEYPSSNKMKSGSDSLRKKGAGTYTKSYDVKTMKSGSDSLRKKGAGTYTKSYDVKTKKSSAASTAATSAAASSGRKRPSTRYQRNELAMEQRNRSSSGQRKSILSLFRKG